MVINCICLLVLLKVTIRILTCLFLFIWVLYLVGTIGLLIVLVIDALLRIIMVPGSESKTLSCFQLQSLCAIVLLSIFVVLLANYSANVNEEMEKQK